jgi:hypothetical protein
MELVRKSGIKLSTRRMIGVLVLVFVVFIAQSSPTLAQDEDGDKDRSGNSLSGKFFGKLLF